MRFPLFVAAIPFLTGCIIVDAPGDRTPPRDVVITETVEVAPPPPTSPEAALELYYDTLPASFFPTAGAMQSIPADSDSISRILVGSCNNEETPSPVMAQMAAQEADLALLIGDNVYGDRDGRAYNSNEPLLDELRESFADLAASDEFQALNAAHPLMVAWDDHDYGANDAGGEFVFKYLAERIHERFWGLDSADVGKWPGTYYARSFGPEGQRVQVIMLDTRFFRSALTPTDEWGVVGKERYIPSDDDMQDMLGAAQWTWLENQLQQPADVRLIVSSIQILTTDGHGFEHWNGLPAERQHLFDLINSTQAEGVVFVSGDRHSAFLYRDDTVLSAHPVHELTASSMNMSFRETTDERDQAQLGDGVAIENFGAIEIDWEADEISLQILNEAGDILRETAFQIPS